jgi:hypothetical protein
MTQQLGCNLSQKILVLVEKDFILVLVEKDFIVVGPERGKCSC